MRSSPSYLPSYQKFLFSSLPVPPGWKAVRDAQGRERYVHTLSGFESWLLEEDSNLPENLKAELKPKDN